MRVVGFSGAGSCAVEIALSIYPRARSLGGVSPRAILMPEARSAVGGYAGNAAHLVGLLAWISLV